MKDIFSLATFAGKILCLAVFAASLRPEGIGAVQAPVKPPRGRVTERVQLNEQSFVSRMQRGAGQSNSNGNQSIGERRQ
ncbi:hypothetical protein Q3C01_10690 [Bradyrhizobium sp. UFLA05-109]